ncbi:MAG: DUF2793 domain-containing protein [Pseudomonadota bacterium]
MQTTANLRLPFLAAAQAQKHVTVNEAFRGLDTLCQLVVQSLGLDEPPTDPASGETFIVGASPIADWAGHGGEIATFQDGAWAFHAPQPGWQAYDLSARQVLVYQDETWAPLSQSGEMASRFGVNTMADNTNRLAVKSDAVLISHDDVTPGTGDIRQTLNKSTGGATGSLIFQTGYQERAEIGLPSGDDFQIKVSGDGASWNTALHINRTSGRIGFPSGGVRELLEGPRTYFIRQDGNDANDGRTNSSGGAFRTIAAAYGAVAGAIDAGNNAITFAIGDGTYADPIIIRAPIPGASKVLLRGNTTTPANVTIALTGYSFQVLGQAISISGMQLQNATAQGIYLNQRASLFIESGVVFGSCPRFHVEALGGSFVEVAADYEVVGSALAHVSLSNQSWLRMAQRTVTINGAPSFTNFYRVAQGSSATLFSNTWSGSATGARYEITGNSIVDMFGQSEASLPGDSNGSAQSGGLLI